MAQRTGTVFVGVAIEDGIGGLDDVGFDDGAGGVEAGAGDAGVDFGGDAEIGGEGAGGAEGDEQAALFDEFLEFDDAFEAHAAGDVVRGAVVAEIFELVGLGVGERGFALGDVGDEGLGAAALVGDDDDVVVGVQIALDDALFVDEVVGDFVLIEGVADPADVLRAAPGAEHGEAGEAGVVHGDRWAAAVRAIASRPRGIGCGFEFLEGGRRGR